MSASGTTHRNFFQRAAIGGVYLIAAVILVGSIDWLREKFYPSEKANLRAVDTFAAEMGKRGADIANERFAKTVDAYDGTNADVVMDAALAAASGISMEQAIVAATRARANNELLLEKWEYTHTGTKWSDCVDFYSPLEVHSVTGYVSNLRKRTRNETDPIFAVPNDDGYEKVGPQGTQRNGVGDGYALPFPNDAHYLAFIGRVANKGTGALLTAPFLIGGDRRFDPKVVGAMGCFQTAVNQNENLSEAKGGWKWKFKYVN